MRPFDFPPAVVAEIATDRFHHPSAKVQRRMEVLWLTAHGVPRAEVIRLSKHYLSQYVAVFQWVYNLKVGVPESLRRLLGLTTSSAP